jgi:hypothetical protein
MYPPAKNPAKITRVPQSAGLLVALFLFSGVLAGCSSGTEAPQVVDDNLWANGQLISIVETQHYSPNAGSHSGYSEESDHLSGKDWSLFIFPFPSPSGHPTRRNHFAQMTGANYLDGFTAIAGSDLLIHQVGAISEEQLFVFDPGTSQDISKPFPSEAEPHVFNRSRTACLGLDQRGAVVYDLLSARAGALKISPRPQWTTVMMGWEGRGGRAHPVLSEDAQHLIVLPRFESPSYINASNFFVEAYSINGEKEVWTIPVNRNWEQFVDAEWLDGKVALLTTLNGPGKLATDLKLVNMQGENASYRIRTISTGECALGSLTP